MTTWRKILAVLKDDSLNAAEPKAIVARAAARVAADRGTAGHRPRFEEALSTAREEFAVHVDARQARAGLNAPRRADG